MMKWIRGVMARLLLVTVSLAFGLVTIELGIRVFGLYRFPVDDFVQSHPELGWSHVPNKQGYWIVGKDSIPVEINSKGLRDREYSYEKDEGTFRILVLGDSFTEGFQVPLEDTFCKVLEYKLNETQRHFEVINAGFAGVGTDYELLFFRREGYKYHPDSVIVAFFANDVYDNYRSKQILASDTAPVAYERKGFVAGLRTFLAGKSCAYNYFGYVLPKHVPSVAKVLMKLGLLSYQPIDDAQGVPQLQYMVFQKEYGPELERAWRVTENLMLLLKEEVENQGSKLAVFSIPFREQIEEDLWRSKLSRSGMEKREWDLNKPDRILSEVLNYAGIPFLQLVPHFRKAAEGSALYHAMDKNGRDGHWNVDGHRLAGQVIYDWLVEERLLPIEAED
jgi:hypothetical protein